MRLRRDGSLYASGDRPDWPRTYYTRNGVLLRHAPELEWTVCPGVKLVCSCRKPLRRAAWSLELNNGELPSIPLTRLQAHALFHTMELMPFPEDA